MITSGVFPRLTDSDPVYAIKTWTDMMVDRLEGSEGWVNLSLASGWTSVNGYPLQVRKVGKHVYVRGIVKFTSGVYTNAITTLPAKYRPSGSNEMLQLSIAGTSRVVVQPFAFTSGSVSIPSGSAYTTGNMTGGDNVVISGSWVTDAT